MIDTLGHRDGSRAATPEFLHSPIKKCSSDLTTFSAATIDLEYYSGMGGSIDSIEATTLSYCTVPETEAEDPLQKKRDGHSSTGDVPMPSVLLATGVCARLDYFRVNITGKRDMNDFAGVSLYC